MSESPGATAPAGVLLAPRLEVHRPSQSRGAAADLVHALELLQQVKAGERAAMLRLYRPEPTVAFGQRDARLPGFAAAERSSREHGFVPAVRRAGGRAAAYHQGTLVVDHLQREPDAMIQAKPRFVFFAELFVQALRSLGVDAGVGEIPGEYCPGEFSVYGRGTGHSIKLVGTAQRVVAGAYLFSSVIVVEDSAPIRQVLTATYSDLGLDWDPRTAGAAADLLPHITVADVEAAVLAAYAGHTTLVEPGA